ncbi:hypothetical protein [Salinibius halmophilus]|nr:hypothetical protein [Salinibius halmophilus]
MKQNKGLSITIAKEHEGLAVLLLFVGGVALFTTGLWLGGAASLLVNLF